jgi:hypothetical protein
MTPQETALPILAELTLVRRGGLRELKADPGWPPQRIAQPGPTQDAVRMRGGAATPCR